MLATLPVQDSASLFSVCPVQKIRIPGVNQGSASQGFLRSQIDLQQAAPLYK